MMIGRKLCESVLEYSRVSEDKTAKSRMVVDMTKEMANHAFEQQQLVSSQVNVYRNSWFKLQFSMVPTDFTETLWAEKFPLILLHF